MELWGRITAVSGHKVTLSVENLEELAKLSLLTTEAQPEAVIQISDKRHISAVQRKKAYAIMNDIADYRGFISQEDKYGLKNYLKQQFNLETGHEYFSFKTVDMTTARRFISFLLDFVLKFNIPLKKPLMEYSDDLEASEYSALKYRKCIICGKEADVHHIDAVGMGNDRKLVDHRGRLLIALCREHHQEAHNMGWPTFKDEYHVEGVTLDEDTLIQLHIMTRKRMEEIDNAKSSSANGTTD